MGKGPEQTFFHKDIQTIHRYMRRCSTPLIIRKMQIKNIMRYLLTPVRVSTIKRTRDNKYSQGCGEKGTLYTAVKNVNWYSHYGKQQFLKKLKIELPYDPAVPLLDIYPEKTIIQKDTCTPMFIAALFTIARSQKQPKCPSTDEWIKKMWHIYTMQYYSAIKRNEIE